MLKHLLQQTDFPFFIGLGVLFLAVLFLWFGSNVRRARLFATSSLFLFLLFSNRAVATFLLGRLEDRYPPLLSIKDLGTAGASIRHIVVLGALPHFKKNWPISSQVGATMLVRLVEGIRLYRETPNAMLVLSGGGEGDTSDAKMMEGLALSLGIPEKSLILETASTNTYEEAVYLKEILKGQKFILVTSARHMPRSVALFQKAGLDPIPAPTGHLVDSEENLRINTFIPRSGLLWLCSEAIYEYLGFFKAKLNRQI